MLAQEEGAVSRRRFRLGIVITACASGLLVMGAQLVTPVHFRAEHAKRIAELEAREMGLFQALAGKDELFQNERRGYVERIKKRDELLRQREQTITLLRSRLAADGDRSTETGEPVGLTARASATPPPGSTSGR
jgi:hypothetical protein